MKWLVGILAALGILIGLGFRFGTHPAGHQPPGGYVCRSYGSHSHLPFNRILWY